MQKEIPQYRIKHILGDLGIEEDSDVAESRESKNRKVTLATT